MTTPQEDITSAQEPEQLHQLFVSGINAHDIDRLMALYEPNAVAADLEGRLLRNIADLREFLTGLLTVVKHLDGETRRVIVAGDIALLSNAWRVVMVTAEGETVHSTGTSAEVARRQPDGTWRFVIDEPRFVNIQPQS